MRESDHGESLPAPERSQAPRGYKRGRPLARDFTRPRVRTVHPRDESTQSQLLVGQLELLDRAGVDGAFVMSFSFPLAPTARTHATT